MSIRFVAHKSEIGVEGVGVGSCLMIRGCEISQIEETYISMYVILHPSFPWTWRIVVDTI